MAFRVRLSRRAERDLRELYGNINAADSAGAARWFARLEQTIQMLAGTPTQCKVTRGDPSAREIIYGKRPHLYRTMNDMDEVRKSEHPHTHIECLPATPT